MLLFYGGTIVKVKYKKGKHSENFKGVILLKLLHDDYNDAIFSEGVCMFKAYAFNFPNEKKS